MNKFNERSIDFGIGADQIFGGSIPLDTANFNGLLSTTEDTIQKALDKLDDIDNSDIGLSNVTNDAQLKASDLVTTVDNPGSDSKIPSEQAVREAITSAGGGSSLSPFFFLGS